jgi:hypothetical protein
LIVLKENETYLVLDEEGSAGAAPHGVYRNDTRQLSRWVWNVEGARSLIAQGETRLLRQHLAVTSARRVQTVGLERRLEVSGDGFEDRWRVTNTSATEQSGLIALSVEGEFRDLFATWSETNADGDRTVLRSESERGLTLARTASDGVQLQAQVEFEFGASLRKRARSPGAIRWAPDRATNCERGCACPRRRPTRQAPCPPTMTGAPPST